MGDPPPKYENVIEPPPPYPQHPGFHPPPYASHPYPHSESTITNDGIPSAPLRESNNRITHHGYSARQLETSHKSYVSVPVTQNGTQATYLYQISPVTNQTASRLAPSMVPPSLDPVPDVAAITLEPGPESKFATKAIKYTFVKRVFSVLYFQFLVIAGLICLFLFEPTLKEWCKAHGVILFLSFVCIAIVLMITWCECTRRESPQNVIFLGIIPLAMGFFLGTLAAITDTISILLGTGVTSFVCGAITLFSVFVLLKVVGFTIATIGTTATVATGISLSIYGVHILSPDFSDVDLLSCFFWSGFISCTLVCMVVAMMESGYKQSLDPEEWIYAVHSVYVDSILGCLKYACRDRHQTCSV